MHFFIIYRKPENVIGNKVEKNETKGKLRAMHLLLLVRGNSLFLME
jgi:hypothetical protein